MKKSKLLEFTGLSLLENANSPGFCTLADYISVCDPFDILLAPLQSNSEALQEQGIRAICCLLNSDLFRQEFISNDGIEIICKLLYSNNLNISTHAAGAFGNLFISPKFKDYLSDSILLALFRLICSSNDSYQQKIILRTFTSIAHQSLLFFFLFVLLFIHFFPFF